MTKFLITGARAPVALEIARNLDNNGHDVVMADSLRFPIAKNTNSIDNFYAIEKPRNNIEAFKASLIKIIKKEKIEYLVPTCEEVFYISYLKCHIEKYCKVICPPFELIHKFHSKSKILDLCKGLEIDIPETSVLSLENLKKTSNFTGKIIKREYCRFGTDVILNPTSEIVQKINHCNQDHQFLLQEKIFGTELCAYAISSHGQISIQSIYQPTYKLKKAAGIYFHPIENEAIKTFIEKFCSKHKFTGQISFDFIVNDHGTYIIECNPRATSGIHLLSNGNFSSYLTGKKASQTVPQQTKPKMIRLIMLFYSLPRALFSSQLKVWFKDFKSADDVIFSQNDKGFFLYQFLSVSELLFIAIKNKISIREASTTDIEWDGEDIS